MSIRDQQVLRSTLIEEADCFGDRRDCQALIGLIDRRRLELQTSARPFGEWLFSEKTLQLAACCRGYWNVRRAQLSPTQP